LQYCAAVPHMCDKKQQQQNNGWVPYNNGSRTAKPTRLPGNAAHL
jgi:hypothetical protein